MPMSHEINCADLLNRCLGQECTGIEAARELHEAGSKAKLLFLTVHQSLSFVRECFAEGGLGYVTKSRLVTDLVPAINEALSNRIFVSPICNALILRPRSFPSFTREGSWGKSFRTGGWLGPLVVLAF
jgi:DNA-binding NarL/FixJ family response regulator